MPPRPAPILVIEAHPDVRMALQMALEFAEYEVHVTSGVKDGLRVLEELGRPGLVLLDESLPEVDRARLVQHVRQTPSLRAVPLVLLSMGETRRPEGFQALLRKPFTLDRLYAVVTDTCEVRDVPRTRKVSGLRPVAALAEPTASRR